MIQREITYESNRILVYIPHVGASDDVNRVNRGVRFDYHRA